jgi:predicted secreted acid phosphatase
MVQSGGDVQTALANAASSQRNNLLSAQSTVDVRSIGDAYSDFSDIFKRSKEASEYRRGLNDGIGNEFGSLFGFGNGGP